mmetsp:Transcript_19395/g.54047  ORF Transcript_19395/g.54047 Transcript_19395/m.54047 type:complete len:496 (-) Transcript_19395:220-1707(-)
MGVGSSRGHSGGGFGGGRGAVVHEYSQSRLGLGARALEVGMRVVSEVGLALFAVALGLYRTQRQHGRLSGRTVQGQTGRRRLRGQSRSRQRRRVGAPRSRSWRRFELRRRSGGSLLFRPLHLQAPIRVVPVKGFVPVGTRVGTLRHAAKSVQIELPLERGQLGVPKVPGQNVRDKEIRIPYHKGVSLWQPAHDVGVFLAEHLHELARERIGMSRRRRSRSGRGRRQRGRNRSPPAAAGLRSGRRRSGHRGARAKGGDGRWTRRQSRLHLDDARGHASRNRYQNGRGRRRRCHRRMGRRSDGLGSRRCGDLRRLLLLLLLLLLRWVHTDGIVSGAVLGPIEALPERVLVVGIHTHSDRVGMCVWMGMRVRVWMWVRVTARRGEGSRRLQRVLPIGRRLKASQIHGPQLLPRVGSGAPIGIVSAVSVPGKQFIELGVHVVPNGRLEGGHVHRIDLEGIQNGRMLRMRGLASQRGLRMRPRMIVRSMRMRVRNRMGML